MDRDRIIILAVVFASSHWAVYASTKIIIYVQQAIHVLKLLYTSNCTGTEFSFIQLKKFSLYLIFVIKYLLNCLNLQNVLLHQFFEAVTYSCDVIETTICFLWDWIIFLNCEIHHSSSYVVGIWLPAFLSDAIYSLYYFVESWSYSSGLGSFAVIFVIFIFCSVLYFTFLITLVIIRLYKLFLKPLIKMLTTLLNYRRRFVLRSRGL